MGNGEGNNNDDNGLRPVTKADDLRPLKESHDYSEDAEEGVVIIERPLTESPEISPDDSDSEEE